MASKKNKKRGPKPAPLSTAPETTLGPTLALRYQILICVFLLVIAICVIYPELVFQNKVLHAGDVEASAGFGIPIQKEMQEKNVYPLWNPYLYGGMPSYESLSYTPHVY
ncbi:MAG: hypothetical protein V3V49_05990, partial [Candidatus Krumholzibacteria bacterium]